MPVNVYKILMHRADVLVTLLVSIVQLNEEALEMRCKKDFLMDKIRFEQVGKKILRVSFMHYLFHLIWYMVIKTIVEMKILTKVFQLRKTRLFID